MRSTSIQHASRVATRSVSKPAHPRGTLVRRAGLLVAAMISLFAAACDGDGGGGTAGDGGTGGTTTTGGTGGTGGTVTTGGTGGTGGNTVCGGLGNPACADAEYCDFPDDAMCGAADDTGLCEPKPEGCTADCPGVCGCDGQFYCNACVAAQAGVDVDPNASCTPQEACGGIAGTPCDATSYCDFPADAVCGNGDMNGLCLPRPEGCTEDCPGVCGCDGQFYCNECIAAQAGVDVNPDIDCAM